MGVTRDRDRKPGARKSMLETHGTAQGRSRTRDRDFRRWVHERPLKVDEQERKAARDRKAAMARKWERYLSRRHDHPAATAWVALEPRT